VSYLVQSRGPPVLDGSDGTLYGTTTDRGTNRLGTVFRIRKDGSGHQLLVSFANGGSTGRGSALGLARGHDGAFYGVTRFGGIMDSGTLFRSLSEWRQCSS
jgi:uncharacterized repeat protein (TIGR03803 family)